MTRTGSTILILFALFWTACSADLYVGRELALDDAGEGDGDSPSTCHASKNNNGVEAEVQCEESGAEVSCTCRAAGKEQTCTQAVVECSFTSGCCAKLLPP